MFVNPWRVKVYETQKPYLFFYNIQLRSSTKNIFENDVLNKLGQLHDLEWQIFSLRLLKNGLASRPKVAQGLMPGFPWRTQGQLNACEELLLSRQGSLGYRPLKGSLSARKGRRLSCLPNKVSLLAENRGGAHNPATVKISCLEKA